MTLERYLRQGGEWLNGTGPHANIVISSRIRLARNIERYKFISRMTDEDRLALLGYVKNNFDSNKNTPDFEFINIHELDPTDRQFLLERHLISKEMEENNGPRGVVVNTSERISIMVNEEDHIRTQVLLSGLQLDKCWEIANQMDDILETDMCYSFSPYFGYLTACPTNVGTGMRVSVMFHLPALVITQQLSKIFQAISKIGLAIRGFYGEGTESLGDFYQISNQVTLGKSEKEIIHNLMGVIPQIIRYEENARETLLNNNIKILEDRVWRAYALLYNARIISSKEAMALLSNIRLGMDVGILSMLDTRLINEIFIFSQPAHLQKLFNKTLSSEERDIKRADYIRKRLNP